MGQLCISYTELVACPTKEVPTVTFMPSPFSLKGRKHGPNIGRHQPVQEKPVNIRLVCTAANPTEANCPEGFCQ